MAGAVEGLQKFIIFSVEFFRGAQRQRAGKFRVAAVFQPLDDAVVEQRPHAAAPTGVALVRAFRNGELRIGRGDRADGIGIPAELIAGEQRDEPRGAVFGGNALAQGQERGRH